MEILQHGMSGELYAARYADGMHFDQLDGIAGPLSAQEAIQILDSGNLPDYDPEDTEWAKNQPWNPWAGEALARMCADDQDALYE